MASANQTERFTRRLRNGVHAVLGHRVREVTMVTWRNGVRTELNRAECECGWISKSYAAVHAARTMADDHIAAVSR